jgi:hypothetical protein
MDAKLLLALIPVFSLNALLPAAVHADHGGSPMPVIEPLDNFGLPVGETDERFFPNEVLSGHYTTISFSGSFANGDFINPANITLWLSWRDPSLPTGEESTASQQIVVPPRDRRAIQTGVVLTFTPAQVGIHIENSGPGGPIGFTDALSHINLAIPEPRALCLTAIAILTVAIAKLNRSSLRIQK